MNFVISKKQNKSRRLQQRRRLNQNGDGEQQDENLSFMSKSFHDDYQSARAHLYRVSNTVMPDVMAKKISRFIGGI